MVKNAFTMIEMIFAIVLIALVVVAVPQIMSRNVQTIEGNRAQEAVFLASAAAKRILSFRWDANSQDQNVTSASELAYSKVLDIPGVTSRVSVTVDGNVSVLPLRIGHIRQEKHRRFHSNVTVPAGTASSTSFEDDVTITSLQGANAFKFNYGLTTNVIYTSTFGSTSDAGAYTNTKMATINVTNNDTGQTDVIMRVFAFNIGETDIAKRTFQ